MYSTIANRAIPTFGSPPFSLQISPYHLTHLRVIAPDTFEDGNEGIVHDLSHHNPANRNCPPSSFPRSAPSMAISFSP
jgi:hypothetical protein